MAVKFYISARYSFVIVAMLGFIIAFMLRTSINMAITGMVVPPCMNSSCNNENGTSNKGTKFHWDEKTQGIILSSFYWGYILTHIPGGILSLKYGGKYVFGLGILFFSILNVLTPLVVQEDPSALIIMRFLGGIGEGVFYPALYTLLAEWAPPSEKGVMSTTIFLGAPIGTLFTSFLGGGILEYATKDAWKLIFYIFGMFGIIWYILWQIFCYNDPSTHPFISKEEKIYLMEEIGKARKNVKFSTTPWREILTSVPVWALIIGEMGFDWGLFTMITDLPKYLHDVWKLNHLENGVISGVPYFVMMVMTCVSGILNDWLLKKKLLSSNTTRKFFSAIGSFGPALGMVVASYTNSKIVLMICLIISFGSLSFSFGSIGINALDLSPCFSGSIMALVSGFGCLSGILAPTIIGLLTTNRTVEEWRLVFWIMAAVLILCNIIFLSFGSCKLQYWNHIPNANPESKEQKSKTKDNL